MLGILADLVGKARSDTSIGDRLERVGADESDTAGQDSSPESTLFECNSCGNVYVAVEKTECGSCDGAISQIDDSSVK